MVFASNLGFPRIGAKRQLKRALEQYWAGRSTEAELIGAGKQLRLDAWKFQSSQQVNIIPSNDFSFYDHVLDTIAMLGAVPKRFRWNGDQVDLRTYFLMARGSVHQHAQSNGMSVDVPAMEMTKWFNTNYHFIVPEIEEDRRFKLASLKFLHEYVEAAEHGIQTRPVLLGPVSFLYLAKGTGLLRQHLLESIVDVYVEALVKLKNAGAQSVQIDEPCLVLDLNENATRAFRSAYRKLSEANLPITVATYFGPAGRNLSLALELPISGIHVDLVDGKDDLDSLLSSIPTHMHLSAGVVDGRNVWASNLNATADLLESIAEKIGTERLIVAPSCSLLHLPVDVNLETRLPEEVRARLAFAKQKVQEISVLTDILCVGRSEHQELLSRNSKMFADSAALRRSNSVVSRRIESITPDMSKRSSAYAVRRKQQERRFGLPLLPTTTIGSFPQTDEIREARKKWKTGELSTEQYELLMQGEIKNNIVLQEKMGLDVFVHGEPERTDMVEYFAEQLQGIAVTQHGWVQSFGSRYVRPPIIHADIHRPASMTVKWARFAQEQTRRPVKGMLTGPVTMMQWSFVRNDQPRRDTCAQLALAIRDEVAELESAGIKIIQIDEPAIREGLPLRRADWPAYLEWSTECFRLSSSGVADDTQIHTHMCYSEFGDMVRAIAEMDADVISIEAARSQMEFLDSLQQTGYPNEIGPGLFDIHSPRIPATQELDWLIEKALKVIPAEKLWINPDCGLKTRRWQEVIPALNAMVEVAQKARTAISRERQTVVK